MKLTEGLLAHAAAAAAHEPRPAAFWRWFDGSRLIRPDGTPLVLYHGTVAEICAFEPNRATDKDAGWYGRGIYLTSDPDTASAYSGYEEMQGQTLSGTPRVMPVLACLRNPYVWPKGRAAATTPQESLAIRQELEAAGHDGVIVPNEYAAPEYADCYEVVAFRPEQIKSVFNQGRWSSADPDLLASQAIGGEDCDRDDAQAPERRHRQR